MDTQWFIHMNGLITGFIILYGPPTILAVAVLSARLNRDSRRKAALSLQPSMRTGVVVKRSANYSTWMPRHQTS